MKLYWRYKKDGKWTWKPVGDEAAMKDASIETLESIRYMEEEE